MMRKRRTAGIHRAAPQRLRGLFAALLAGLLCATLAGTAGARHRHGDRGGDGLDLDLVETLHAPAAEHMEQQELLQLVIAGDNARAFEESFEAGDELFETTFNALDGVGANVGQGQRFTRLPRMDLVGFGEWANHTPARATGPNAESCVSCHRQPTDDGAGPASENVIRDPLRTGQVSAFINRNTPHLFGAGGVQRLAEEMTVSLHRDLERAIREARWKRDPVRRELRAKGVPFGSVTAFPNGWVDFSDVEGVDRDLVVRPFQWKGNFPTVRAFNRDASHGELGMQAVEIVGHGVDGDFDGVSDEMTIGDQTVLAVYIAAQPRPTTRTELALYGLIPPIAAAELDAISRGEVAFHAAECASCHVPELRIRQPEFSEPSRHPAYRDAVFPAGQVPAAEGVDPRYPVTFDLTHDQPDNVIEDENGQVVVRLGAFESDGNGGAIVRLFGDLKRHDMGRGMAESVDETGAGASVFLTENLWGVGSTAPYLHDGRATTLTEAILAHGGEGAGSRAAFQNLSTQEQADLLAFLNNQVLFLMAEE